jgi:hypothetical protein
MERSETCLLEAWAEAEQSLKLVYNVVHFQGRPEGARGKAPCGMIFKGHLWFLSFSPVVFTLLIGEGFHV